jgi:hypothetical protein
MRFMLIGSPLRLAGSIPDSIENNRSYYIFRLADRGYALRRFSAKPEFFPATWAPPSINLSDSFYASNSVHRLVSGVAEKARTSSQSNC